MNARQFFDKVALMRKLQKEYFRTRSKTALNQSKAVEREVDAEIARVHDATMRMGLYRNPPSLQRLSEEVVLAANTLESDATQLPLRPTVDNVKYPHFRAK